MSLALRGDLPLPVVPFPTPAMPASNFSAPAITASAEVRIAGVAFTALANGALWQNSDRLLIVADLHLEKGSSFARRGQLLPPYDTAATLAALSELVFRLDPAAVVALGDSFHDNAGAERLGSYDRAALSALQRGREWLWVAGNHDDDLPAAIGGEHVSSIAMGPLTLRHEPSESDGDGEIAGHLHPAARVAGRAGSVRRRCFIGDGSRLILPAFGAYAGGLNVLDLAFRSFFPRRFTAFVLGNEAVYPVSRSRLCGG